jgi:hypothetical protein
MRYASPHKNERWSANQASTVLSVGAMRLCTPCQQPRGTPRGFEAARHRGVRELTGRADPVTRK